jgi:hypothetical protein
MSFESRGLGEDAHAMVAPRYVNSITVSALRVSQDALSRIGMDGLLPVEIVTDHVSAYRVYVLGTLP